MYTNLAKAIQQTENVFKFARNSKTVSPETKNRLVAPSNERVRCSLSGGITKWRQNGPFPNYLRLLIQSESWCSSFHTQINFHSHENEFELACELACELICIRNDEH